MLCIYNLFIKYFGRLLALLGCTTMVTACYGIPVDPETHWIEGLISAHEAGDFHVEMTPID